jgi:hypothetical protein
MTVEEAAQARPRAMIKQAIFMSSPGRDDAARMIGKLARVDESEDS